MKAAILSALNKARAQRQAAVVLTTIADGSAQLLLEGAFDARSLPETVADAAAKAFRSGKSSLLESEGLFLNAHLPPARIVVIGAVHISQALAAMAKIAGYDLTIIDPRTAFATPERFEGVDLQADWPEDVLKDRPLDAYCALVAVTHDPKIDDFPIMAALKSHCFYVGALGSRKTHAKRVERLQAAGFTEAQINRISAPIGLDIGASSPEEIAVAILADIIAAFRKRSLLSGDAA